MNSLRLSSSVVLPAIFTPISINWLSAHLDQHVQKLCRKVFWASSSYRYIQYTVRIIASGTIPLLAGFACREPLPAWAIGLANMASLAWAFFTSSHLIEYKNHESFFEEYAEKFRSWTLPPSQPLSPAAPVFTHRSICLAYLIHLSVAGLLCFKLDITLTILLPYLAASICYFGSLYQTYYPLSETIEKKFHLACATFIVGAFLFSAYGYNQILCKGGFSRLMQIFAVLEVLQHLLSIYESHRFLQ